MNILLEVRLLFSGGVRESFVVEFQIERQDGYFPSLADVQAVLVDKGYLVTADGGKVSWDTEAVLFMSVEPIQMKKPVEPTEAPPRGMR